MIRIEIKSTDLRQKSGTSGRGKAYSFKEQSAWAHLPDKPYPVEIVLTRNDNEPPFAVGLYDLAPASFYVDGFGSLAIKPRLSGPVTAKG